MECKKCGQIITDGATVCEHCGQNINEPVAAQVQTEAAAPAAPAAKKENVLTGTVGALIGAVIGAAAIILISQLGYVASISGLILAVCVIKGYELLGGKLGIAGALICLVLVLVTPYVADRIDWALMIMDAYKDEGVTLAQAFAAVPALVDEGSIDSAIYTGSLVKLYIFAALGGFGTLVGMFKKKA